jgi:hypothetical protein
MITGEAGNVRSIFNGKKNKKTEKKCHNHETWKMLRMRREMSKRNSKRKWIVWWRSGLLPILGHRLVRLLQLLDLH